VTGSEHDLGRVGLERGDPGDERSTAFGKSSAPYLEDAFAGLPSATRWSAEASQGNVLSPTRRRAGVSAVQLDPRMSVLVSRA